LVDSENYLTKLSRARKNYMPNWAYAPYLYNKISLWFNYYNNQLFFDNITNPNIKLGLSLSSNFWTLKFNSVSTSQFTPSFSGLNNHNKITWVPLHNLTGRYYTESILIDILSKREYLYRSFF
jgi:hypothetical protein